MATLNWLSNPDRYYLPNPTVRPGCAVWLEGQSYEFPPTSFTIYSVWSPNLAFVRRHLNLSERERRGTIRCTGVAPDCTSERAVALLPEWGRRRFVFCDDQGAESPALRVVRRVAPTPVRLALPSVGVAVAELPGGAALGKAELDLSKSLNVEFQLSAAIDPPASVSLISGRDLSPAWAYIVAAESGLDSGESTAWLLRSLQDGQADQSTALAFLGALETVGATALSLPDAFELTSLLEHVLETTPFARTHEGPTGAGLAAARDYAVLMGWWGVDGLRALADHDADLRGSPGSIGFFGEPESPELTADLELGDEEPASIASTLQGFAPDVTRFGVKVVTTVDGLEDTEYSNIVSVGQREGDLVWWEDADHVTVVEGQLVFV